MEDMNKDILPEEGAEIYTLTDDDGNEFEVELLASFEFEGKLYRAITPYEPDAADKKDTAIEYDILQLVKDEDGSDILTSIEDDEEFDRVADYFDDAFFGQVDYD